MSFGITVDISHLASNPGRIHAADMICERLIPAR